METYRKASLIYNPFAGRLKGREPALRQCIELLAARGMVVDAIPTTGPATASDIARGAIDRGADLILVAGGDGTINEVVNGMVGSDVPLGILPAGTANVLATELRTGKTLKSAAGKLGECVQERIALGRFSNGPESTPRHFLMMGGVGLDAHIVYNLDLSMKAALGKVAYWVGGFAQLGRRLPEFIVQAEGREFRVSFALASRVRNYGGDLEIAPTISLLDDHFELVLFEGQSAFPYLKFMVGALVRRLSGMRGVTILRTRDAVFSMPADSKIHVQLDGEYAGLLPARIEIVPNALTLLVPAGFRARRPASLGEPAWTTSPTR